MARAIHRWLSAIVSAALFSIAACDTEGDGTGGDVDEDALCGDLEPPASVELPYDSAAWLFDDGEGGFIEGLEITNSRIDCENGTYYECHPSRVLWVMGFSGRTLEVGPISPNDHVIGGNELHMDADSCAFLGPVEPMPFETFQGEILEITDTCILGHIVLTPTLYQGIDGAEVGDVYFRAPRCGEFTL